MSSLMGHLGMLLKPAVIIDPLKWSLARKFADITLSNGDLTATIPSDGAYKAILAGQGKASGKWQFEIVCNTVGGEFKAGISAHEVGGTYNWTLGQEASALQSVGHYRSGTIYWYLAASNGWESSYIVFENGTVIGVTIDLTDPKLPIISMYCNGLFQKTLTAGPSEAWYPAFSAGYNTVAAAAVATLRGTGLQYPVAGFTPWNGA